MDIGNENSMTNSPLFCLSWEVGEELGGRTKKGRPVTDCIRRKSCVMNGDAKCPPINAKRIVYCRSLAW